MQCFARWREDRRNNLNFRDQTFLQFGNSWELRANLVLLNPGSSAPINKKIQTRYVREQNLPFFVEPDANEHYYEFKLDRLMIDMLKCFSKKCEGGVIKIYNAFNIKNQYSDHAIQSYKLYRNHPFVQTAPQEINFLDAPVIFATGSHVKCDEGLINELNKFYRHPTSETHFVLQKKDPKLFRFTKVEHEDHLLNSYHPSYTFKYGNFTECGDLHYNVG